MSDAAKVLTTMSTGLSPMDAAIFAEVAQVVGSMTKLEISRFIADGGDKLFPQLDTMNKNINTRLGVYARQLALEFSMEATAAPDATGQETMAGQRARITKNEKDRLDALDRDIRKVSAKFEGKRAEASAHLKTAEKAATQTRIEYEAAQANPSIGSTAIEAARQAAQVAKNGLANAANADRYAHEQYTTAMRKAMPEMKREADPLGLGGHVATAPPI